MSDQLTLEVNEKRYALTESLKAAVEERAEREYEENDYVDTYWTENEDGDPILNIETVGRWVPWENLEQLRYEMKEVGGEQQDWGDGEHEGIDEENSHAKGMKTIDPDEVDNRPDPEDADVQERTEDTSFMMTPPNEPYVPQPDEDDPEKVPMDPEEFPDHPALISWMPEAGRDEVWSSGKAIVPQRSFIQWNLQARANSAPDGATKTKVDQHGSTMDVERTDSHDHWESFCQLHDCEVVAELQPVDEPSGQEERKGKEWFENKDGQNTGTNKVGDRWHL